MAVTILERPEGFILSSSAVTSFTVINGGIDDAYFVSGAHGLSTGNIIYVRSFIEEYNGFFKVEVDGAGSFYIHHLDGDTGDFNDRVPFIVAISSGFREYYVSQLTHGWSCVHLPITYKLSTNLYPTNSADTSRTINSVQQANGYTVILISGSLGSGVNSFDFVKLTVPNDTELSGVYQILEFISPTVMIINLLYDSTNNFSGATALKHYNNYNIQVRVYAGINSAHQWTAQKPYELAATIEYIPDEDNEVFFSINEILKSYIETRNNLVLGTLPNNIDFWTNFYIETAESYDDSDGYTFGTNQGNFTSDLSTFEGTAVNAKLEFKNLHSGSLSEYLMTNNTAKFLTLFSIPVLFACGDDTPDCYSDISFLNPYYDITLTVRKQFYLNGNGPVNVDTEIEADPGVIRTELEADCDYDRVDVTIYQIPEVLGLSSWAQIVSGTATWTIDAAPNATLDANLETTYYLYTPLVGISGKTYQVNYNASLLESGIPSTGLVSIEIGFLDSSFVAISGAVTADFGLSSTISGSGNVTVPSGSTGKYLYIKGIRGLTDPDFVFELIINALTVTASALPLSETKEFKINCDCCTYEIRLSWLNNLGGMEPTWVFCGKKDDVIEIQEAMTTKKNILPTWPKSYGENADTIKKQTKRVSNKAYTVRSQHLTQDEVDAISYIKSSLLVQIINSRTDRRTVLVDTDSFVKRKDGDKTFEIAFNISFTDDIPVQTL